MSKGGALAYEIVSEFMMGKLSRKEAALLLEVRERTVSRLARRIEKKGIFGLEHGNRGRAPFLRRDERFKATVMKWVKEKYFDFNMTHCLEMLGEYHGLVVTRETFRRWCHEKGLVKRAKRRKGVARRLRDRMPSEGLLLQMDGSPHEWNRRETWTLIGAIDDATSEIPYAEFFESEDTPGTMKVLRGVIEKKGIPLALYVDKAGCFGGGKRQEFNQFKRACRELDIKLIFACSAEAKGRIERAWDTCQDRLIPELRLYDINRREKANEYVRDKFLPNYWDRKCRVEPRSKESKYRPIPKGMDINEILCIKERRLVNGDHTVSWNAKTYKLDWPQERSIRGHKIEFRTYPDGNWKAFHADDPIAMTVALKPQKLKLIPSPKERPGQIRLGPRIGTGAEKTRYRRSYANA
jgi:transposase